MTTPVLAPSSSVDLFNDVALRDPYDLYATLRDMGPAVHLHRHSVWAITRYTDALGVLTDPHTFSSVDGLALTPQGNQDVLAGTVMASDGPDHVRLRKPLAKRLAPRAFSPGHDAIGLRADTLVANYVQHGTFDGAGLARQLVADMVMERTGLPEETRNEIITTAAATFDCLGPDNERLRASAPAAARMSAFLAEKVSRRTITDGSWTASLYTAADHGEISEADVVPLISAYATAAMDTTYLAITSALNLLATHPHEYRRLRSRGRLAENAFHETTRIAAPIQGLGRRVTRDTTIGDIPIRAGDQLWILFGSTGRDPRKWGPTADTFRIDRPDAADNLSLGAGPHLCAGRSLAITQAQSLLRSLTSRCIRIELSGEPQPVLNNVLQGWSSLPLTAVPDRRRRPHQP
ncbi:cytochrome P450 [Streptomyces sp. NPDC055036]